MGSRCCSFKVVTSIQFIHRMRYLLLLSCLLLAVSSSVNSFCICTEQYEPVCSQDGITYGNQCKASCNNAAIACDGQCPCLSVQETRIRLCLAVYQPVCSQDNITFSND